MSSLINRNRNVVAAIAALLLVLVPLKISSAAAEVTADDTSLSVFTVNGTPVTDNQTVNLDPGTSSVVVEAVTTNPDATRVISGGTSLVTGNNPLIVSVTAADGTTTADHTVTLNVQPAPLSSDATLKTFTVNGNPVVNNQTVVLDPGTLSVVVEAIANDAGASLVTTGGTDLAVGDNQLKVSVTAADGTKLDYNVTLQVQPTPLSSDATLKTFTVNGTPVVDGDDVYLAHGTSSVTAVVETTDIHATFSITGTTGLVDGNNPLVVTVTAEDGTVATYTVNLAVALNSDTSLVTFQVAGNDVVDGSVVELPALTTETDVLVETTDPDALYEINGDTNLVGGENTLEVIVTAADGVTTDSYFVTLNVAFNTDAGINRILIDGVEVVDGEIIDLQPLTSTVAVSVETADPNATVEVTGGTDLVAGENLLTIVVTAADSTTTAEYNVTLNVLRNDDTSLTTFQVNGTDVQDGAFVELDPLTTSVDVFLETADPNATTAVIGDTELVVGENNLEVVVIAADGVTTLTYSVTLNVLPNTDATADVTVNGEVVVDGDTKTYEWSMKSVDVLVTPTDPEATYTIDGDSGLAYGANQLTVTVTAADGVTTETTNVTIVVQPDTSLSFFQVNGVDVTDGSTIVTEPKATSVSVVVETTDPESTYEITGDTDLLVGDNDLVVTVVAGDAETIESYLVTVTVPMSTDTSIASILVDGTEVAVGDLVDLEPLTTDVTIDVTTTDPDATVEVDGGVALVAGENAVSITVTAADGETTSVFEITLVVALNTDTTLSMFQVNGADVADGDVVVVASDDTDVAVDVETTDPEATFVITGDTGLMYGDNDLVVSVTAADGVTVQDYLVTITVPLSNDTSIDSVVIDGTEVAPGDTLDLEPLTTDVAVDVTTTDPDATVDIAGGSGLVAGDNTLTIIVTAADGETTEQFEITLSVALNTDTSLATFQINGADVADGDSVDTEPAATDVDVTVETTDPEATYQIDGDSELVAGENVLVVTVTAADGETTATYTVTVNVPLNNDTSVTSITVNGDEVYNDESIELDPYTTDVDVAVVTTDADATVEIAGNSELAVGDNALTVTVTAADGETTQDYVINLVVLPGDNATLATFQVNGTDVEDGVNIVVAPGTTAVEVTVVTTDPEATFEIQGNEELTTGLNEILVAVTAQNGVDYMEHVATVEVPLNNDTSVTAITVDGNSVIDGDIVYLAAGTTEVDVNVETTDAEADAVIEGGLNLAEGDNSLVITVTAADGETTAVYNITLVVRASDDTSLATFQVNEADVQDGDVIELESLTTEVGVTVETTNPDATYEITGDTDLVAGPNDLTVTVTAADGITVVEYNVILNVASGTSTELTVFTVAGADVTDGDVIDLAPGTSDVEVDAQPEDPNATVTVVGDSGLVAGENTLVVTVVSADESESMDYTITLNVQLGIDTSLELFQIDGNDVANGDVVDLEPGTTSVDVEVVTTDENATYEITGDTNLAVGENDLLVTVTAEDGETVTEYWVTLVLPLNNDTGLTLLEINGSEAVDGDTVDLEAGMTEVFVRVETSDPEATFDIEGGSNLVKGENTLIVHVTAADGETTQDHTVTLYVPSDDASVTSILVNGLLSVSGDIITVAPDAESVDVEVNTTDENAKVDIKGADALVQGENEVVVTVTAEDGTTVEYTFTVRVGGASADTAVTSLTVNGTEVTDGGTVQLPSRTTSVNVVAVTRDPAATVKVTGRTGLVVGKNTIQVAVTAPDLRTVRYIYITAEVAPLSSNTDLAEFTVNGVAVSDKDTIALPPLTRGVTVVAKTADVESVVVISGKTVADGTNTLTVAVTAADGTVRTYTVTMVVRVLSADTSLKTFTIDGADATGGAFTAAPGANSVNVVALATDARATVSIIGATGLRVGANTVSVLVTAENGTSKSYKIAVTVPASNNAGLKSILINGVETAVGSKTTLPRGTKSVTVKATANEIEAKVAVTGGLNLVSGDNNLVVTVTAPDGVTTASYSLNLYVTPPSSDKSLKTFKVNGLNVVDGGSQTVPALTTSVVVEAAATDPEATVVVSGRSNLLEGPNTVSVLVTAADGSTKTYTVTVRVLSLSSDNSLKSLKVNGVDYTTGTVNVAYGVKSITVLAEVNDATASVAIIGNGALRTGLNTVTVRVTAANGAIADTAITVSVAKSNNTALTSLTVNGLGALSGNTVTLPVRTTLATVKAVTADPETTAVASATTLAEGNNTVVLTVTAPDGTVRVVNIPVYVTPLSNNTNLSTFKVNNVSVVDGSVVTVANRTLSVPVQLVTADSEATAVVSGAGALRTGNNTVTATVTAPNGTKKTYTVTVVVLKSSNTALTSLTVNGLDASSGNTVTLPVRTTLATVKAVTADPETTAVASATTLAEGSNTVVLTVTAPDGTVRVVNIPVYVTPLSSNTNLSALKVNNVTVADGGLVNVANKTLSVAVQATAVDAEAVVAVSGNTALRTGNNTVSILVTAPNGSKKTYNITVVVAKSSNTDLNSLTVNGSAIAAGGTATLPVRTTSAVIKAVTTDPEATVAVTGATSLSSGNNTASVTITAADGTTRTVSFTLYVTPLSSDNTLKSLTVNGAAYVANSIVELALGTASVNVSAVANDLSATVEVTGNTGLVGGLNTITIKVTAANGSIANYTAKVNVPVRSSNANISTAAGAWTINGIDVASLASDAVVVELPAGSTAVSAAAKPQDAKATIAITGATGLSTGLNTVTFKVTAEDGTTINTYTRTVSVKALSANANLASLTVAGVTVANGDTVNVVAGTTRVEVIPVLESAEARFTVSGNTGLTAGTHTVSVVVTAPSGATTTTNVTVVVAAPASTTSLSTFTINGVAVTDGSTYNAAAGTTRLHVSAIATDSTASVSITGKAGLVSGSQNLVVTVTAISGAQSTYTVTVVVP